MTKKRRDHFLPFSAFWSTRSILAKVGIDAVCLPVSMRHSVSTRQLPMRWAWAQAIATRLAMMM